MNFNGWLAAYLLTQSIEAPIYLVAARTRPLLQRVGYAFGASTITQPLIWFCLPWQDWPYIPLLIAAESFAIGVEGAWGVLWRVPGPWRASLLANVASVSLGSAIRWWLEGASPQAGG
jgi:hypothetical protein